MEETYTHVSSFKHIEQMLYVSMTDEASKNPARTYSCFEFKTHGADVSCFKWLKRFGKIKENKFVRSDFKENNKLFYARMFETTRKD